jgi:hypothetical protein
MTNNLYFCFHGRKWLDWIANLELANLNNFRRLWDVGWSQVVWHVTQE